MTRIAHSPYTFRKKERLSKNAEIKSLFNTGKRVRCAGAQLFYIGNSLSFNRIAYTLSRKFGNAVQRNRAKRLGREIYRLNKHLLKKGYDLVLFWYPGEDSLVERSVQFHLLMEKADLLTREEPVCS